MDKKITIPILAFIIIVLIGTILYRTKISRLVAPVAPAPDTERSIAPEIQPPSENENSNAPSLQNSNITYLVSKEDKTKFCNGAAMDSEGYRKTITTEIVSDVPIAGLDEAGLAKQTAILSTDGMCQEALKKTYFKVDGGTVEISPIEGWAGISIAMCACKPQVEVNLLRIPGIKQVLWSSN